MMSTKLCLRGWANQCSSFTDSLIEMVGDFLKAVHQMLVEEY